MNIDGSNIYVKYHNENNNKQKILLIHGGPGESCLSFGYLIKELVRFADVVEVDQRGCGRSEHIPPEELSINVIVDDFEKIRNELGIKSWTVLGHSFGGFIALYYGNKYPSSIEKIVLENAAINLQESLSCIIHGYYKYFLKNRKFKYIKELVKAEISGDTVTMLDAVDTIPTHHKRCFWGNDLMSEPAEEVLNFSELDNEQKKNCKSFFGAIKYDECLATDGWELLKTQKCKILFLSGQYDKITNFRIRHKLTRNKNINFLKIQNAGHYIHLANISKMCSAINDN